VIPAARDFFVSISTKLEFLINWGREIFDYEPSPNSPFLPKPQDQIYPSFLCAAK